MNFSTTEKDIHSQLKIDVNVGLPQQQLKVICVSESRNDTSFEILDQDKMSMGKKTFNCSRGPVLGSFNACLVEELNILLEEWSVEVTKEEFRQISELAVTKCEGRYGNNIDGGDCIITIH